MKLKRAVIAGLFVLAGLAAVPASASALAFGPSPASPLTWPEPDEQVTGIAVADLDGNGNDDIVSIGDSNRIQVSLANEAGTGFDPAPGSPFGIGSTVTKRFQVVAGDFGGDSATDLVVVGVVGGSAKLIETYLGDGAGGFPDSPNFTLNSPNFSVWGSIVETAAPAVGDVNEDGFPDIVMGMGDHSFMVALGSATGQFTLTNPNGNNFPTPNNAPLDRFISTTLGDWNGDGNLDAALALGNGNSFASPPAIYVANGNGNGGFTPVGTPVAQGHGQIHSVASIDLDSDEYDDLSFIVPASDQVRTLVGSASGLFTNPSADGVVNTGTGSKPQVQTVADLDNDGDQDIAITLTKDADAGIAVIRSDGDGGIEADSGSPIPLPAIDSLPANPNSVKIGDFNGDGGPDLASGSSYEFGPFYVLGVYVLLAEPDPEVSPEEVDFPDTPAGESSEPVDVSWFNNGSVPITLTDVNFTGDESAFELLPGDCPLGDTTFLPGDGCTFETSFTPTEAGDFEFTFIQEWNDAVETAVTLRGSTGAPEASVDPETVSFGDVISGYPNGLFKTITITSTGGQDLVLTDPVITGPDADEFGITSSAPCSEPLSLGEACNVGIRFEPGADADGFREASLEFGSSNTDEPPVVPLGGNAFPAEYTVTPASKDFGEVKIGSGPSATQAFTVTATGSVPVPFKGVNVDGPDSDSFNIVSRNCADMIPAQENCQINVAFDPKAGSSGERSATLLIDAFSSGPRPDLPITLTGTATEDGPVPPSGEPKLSLKLKAPGRIKRGKTLTVKATVKNTGDATATSVVLKPSVPKKLAKQPKAIKVSSLAAGRSITRIIKVNVRKRARKGKRLKVKLAYSASGLARKTTSRTVKIR